MTVRFTRWAEGMKGEKKSRPNAIRFSMGDIRSGLFSLSYDYRSKQTNKQTRETEEEEEEIGDIRTAQ